MIRVALVALASLLLVRTLLAANLHGVASHLHTLGGRAFLVLVPYAALLVCETLGWQRLFTLLRAPVRFLHLLAVRSCSTGVAACLPGGALAVEGVKPLLLEHVAGVPKAKTTATLAGCKAMLMSTQAVYLSIVVLGASPSLAIAGHRLGVGGALPRLFAFASVLLAVVAAAFVLVVTRAELAERAFRKLSTLRNPRLRTYLEARREAFLSTDRHLVSLFRSPPSSLVRAAAPYLASWFCEALESFVILRLLGVPIGFLEVAAIDASVSLLRSFAFMLPSGLGVTDAAYVGMLAAFGVADPSTIGAAFIVLKRGKELVWIGAGFASFALVRRVLAPSRSWVPVPTRPSTPP